jgi:hypothetical protein
MSHIHAVRMLYEEPIYNILKDKYGQQLKTFWETATFPYYKDTSNTVLLVERREHPNIEFVLQNAMYYCREKQFSLTVICSDVSLEYVKGILGKHYETSLVIPWFTGIGTRDQGRSEYNQTFLNPAFWKQIPAEWILSIQTDSYLRKKIPEELWKYEYAGAPWTWNLRLAGGGGLTWRKKSAMLQILELPIPKSWDEDGVFSHGCEQLDLKVPDDTIRYELLAESHFHNPDGTVINPFGVHQWWTFVLRIDDNKLKEELCDILLECSTD